MKLLFATLLCHRDIEYFLLNWFTMRVHLDKGFDIPHLILNDGSLTDEDFKKLESLGSNLYLEKDKVFLYEGTDKPVYLAKLECFNIGFDKYNADRVVVIDADIFFFRNWESDLRKICISDSIALRDWGSSNGPEPEKFKQVYGVYEDTITPNCNSGIISIPRHQHFKLKPVMQKFLNSPFLEMHDQSKFFAAYYGQLNYVENICCAIMNGETAPEILNWWLANNACHLMGMRERPTALRIMIDYSIQSVPEFVNLKQFTPYKKHISWGLMEYDTYNFNAPLQKIPSTYQGKYITNALYLHGGSWAYWKLPPYCKVFKSKIACMDTGLSHNTQPVDINGQQIYLNSDFEINLNGKLEIITKDGPGSHFAFLNPRIYFNKDIMQM